MPSMTTATWHCMAHDGAELTHWLPMCIPRYHARAAMHALHVSYACLSRLRWCPLHIPCADAPQHMLDAHAGCVVTCSQHVTCSALTLSLCAPRCSTASAVTVRSTIRRLREQVEA